MALAAAVITAAATVLIILATLIVRNHREHRAVEQQFARDVEAWLHGRTVLDEET